MPEGTACPAQARDRFKWEREFRDSGLDVTSQAIGLWIATYANRNGSNAHPGIARLVEHTSTSRATVKRRIALLVEGGWLIRTSRGSQSGRQALSDVFQLAVPIAAEQGSTGDGSGLSETEIRAQSCEPLPRPSHHEENHHSAKRSLPSQARVDDQTAIDPDDYDDEHEWLRDMLSSEFGRDLAPDEESTLYNWAADGVHLKVIENAIRKLAREKPAVPEPRRSADDWQDRVKGTRCPLCGVVGGVQCVDRNRKPLGPNSVHPERFDEAGVPREWAA